MCSRNSVGNGSLWQLVQGRGHWSVCCGTLYVFYIGTNLKVVLVHMQPHKLGPAIHSNLRWSYRQMRHVKEVHGHLYMWHSRNSVGNGSDHESLLVQGRGHGFVPVSMGSRRGNKGCTMTHCRKGWFMMPTSSVRYAILMTIITQKAAANCVSGEGPRNCHGCWKESLHTADMDFN